MGTGMGRIEKEVAEARRRFRPSGSRRRASEQMDIILSTEAGSTTGRGALLAQPASLIV